MKKITFILSVLIMAITLQVSAQTKKKKATAPVKKTVVKKKTTATTTTTTAPAATYKEEPKPAEPKRTAAVATKRASVVSNDYYKTALGLKFLYGISFTVKHFINDKAALEAVIQYRSHSGVGKEFNFTGLYEYHGEIKGASGLRWYAGGGAYVGYFSYDNDQLEELVDESSTTTFGVAGTVGLEYKIKSLPIAISADWQPVYILNGNSGFAADNGGFGIKYTF
jgi:hypothetical protein